MNWVYDDGGRRRAGFTRRDESSRDCVARAIAIATGKLYGEVYDGLHEVRDRFLLTVRESKAKRSIAQSNALEGVSDWVWRKYLENLGWKWHATMTIGSGCRVHLRREELPGGTIIVRCSRHIVAVKDGVIYDTYDCSRFGTRCVYGYYSKGAPSPAGRRTITLEDK